MLKRILVPLDGSEYAEAATAKAVRMAERTGAEVRGLAIIDEPGIMRPEPEPVGAAGFLEHKQATKMQQAGEKAAALAAGFLDACRDSGVKASAIERRGDPVPTIIRESHEVDVLVMGQESCFRFMTQSGPCHTMREVLRASPRPTVVVPKDLVAAQGVWFATDGSNGAARALHMYQMLGLMGKRKVRVLAIHKTENEAKRRCEEAGGFLEAHGHRVVLSAIVTDHHPWEELLSLMKEAPPEIMIMGAYGTSGLKEFFFGSVSRSLIERAPVPLFVFH